ncbi:uncharacterized protein EV422DRAFT_565329 [Fimicolochytrium jonesii]|uniref:uncharacterized protein n=1 Tax=Fimicolochytrium jonesii TaxID=1396493 RepID=UPI0022FDD4D7|nr:uncharacterized protein EV422DRAFT_565329 [Fimicolochytrium jonesii]KAI8823379.1 hypothetical protein EV422DRAFT_565329 [Fimicolochytrium jonesii]
MAAVSEPEPAVIEDTHGSRSYRPFNRGNKLKRTIEEAEGAATLSGRPTIWTVRPIDEELEYAQIGKRRAILRRGKDRSTEDDPYTNVDIEKLWSFPTHITTAAATASFSHTLTNRALKVLSHTAMEMMEAEADFGRSLAGVANVLQGDDPLFQDGEIEKVVGEDLLAEVRGDLQELMSCSEEYIKRMSDMRDRLLLAYTQKKSLAKELMPAKKPLIPPLPDLDD